MSNPESPSPGRKSRSGRVAVLLAIAAAGCIVAFGALLWNLAPAPAPDLGEGARVLPVPLAIPEFSLVDQRGEPFGRSNLEGRWSVLFFGYTYCPDVCPITLQSLASVERLPPESKADWSAPQVVFVSVDPGRDTTERLSEYVGFFHPSFLGVTGTPAEIGRLGRAVGAFFEKEGDAGSEDYLVDHSAVLFLIDPRARLWAVLEDPHDPREFVELLARVQSTKEGS